MAVINGENLSAADGMTVSEYLSHAGKNPNRVAVEFNGYILPKDEYGTALINEGDCIEIVEFMGGG